MSGSVNKVILVGRLGRDPEVKTFDNGKLVNLRLATSERWRNKQTGEMDERTEWHSVVIRNENLADIAERYLRKGSSVYVEGQLQTRKWTDQSGQERYTTEIVLSRFKGELTLLGGRSEGGEQSAPAATERSSGGSKRPAAKSEWEDDLSDSIPFHAPDQQRHAATLLLREPVV